jgi:hypothetical protein
MDCSQENDFPQSNFCSMDLADFFMYSTIRHVMLCRSEEHRRGKTNLDLADFLYIITLDHVLFCGLSNTAGTTNRRVSLRKIPLSANL